MYEIKGFINGDVVCEWCLVLMRVMFCDWYYD